MHGWGGQSFFYPLRFCGWAWELNWYKIDEWEKHLNTLWAHEVSYKKKGGSNKQLGQNLYTIIF